MLNHIHAHENGAIHQEECLKKGSQMSNRVNVKKVPAQFFFFMSVFLSTDRLFASSFSSSSEQHPAQREKEKALVREAKENNSEYVKNALRAGVYVNAVDHTGSGALHYAAQHKNVSLAELLIEWGANVNLQNKIGQTPLHKAVRDDRPNLMAKAEEMVKLLLKNGAQIDITDISKCKPLEYALKGTFTTIVQMLIDLETSPQTSTSSVSEVTSNSLKRKATDDGRKDDQENRSDASSDEQPVFDNLCRPDNPQSRAILYSALKKQDMNLAKKLLVVMAFNRVADPNKLREAYDTIKDLLPQFNGLLKDFFPVYKGRSHIKMICGYTLWPWRDAFLLIFFDELKRTMLKPEPAVQEAVPYAIKFLEIVLAELLLELTPMISREKPSLVTSKVSSFLDPEQVTETFSSLLLEEISLKLENNRFSETTSTSIFDQLKILEDRYHSKTKEETSRYSPDVF